MDVGIPCGATVFGSVVYRAAENDEFDYEDMFRFITRWLFSRRLDIELIEDESDSDSSDDDMDIDDSDSDDSWGLDTEIHDTPVLKKLEKLNLLYLPDIYKEEKRRSNFELQSDDDFSDNDSEEDFEYEYEDKTDIGKNISKEQRAQKLVLNARGLHFYKSHNDIRDRHLYRAYDFCNLLTAYGMYSEDTHKRANVSFKLPDRLDNTREARLSASRQVTRGVIHRLQRERRVAPVLGTSESSRPMYDTRLDELVQRYINSYKKLKADIQRQPARPGTDRTRQKKEILEQFKGIPFVSMSESMSIGLEYAYAELSYDKESHELKPDAGGTLMPEYRANGELRHPYTGVVYVTLHSQQDLAQYSENIIQHFQANTIDTSKGPGTYETSGYIRALEQVFHGGVSNDHMCLAKVVRLPNMYHSYRTFMKDKYGLSEGQYNKFKGDLAKHGMEVGSSGQMRNRKEFYRTQAMIRQHVIDYQQKKLLGQVMSWAKENKVVVGSVDNQGVFCPYKAVNEREKVTAAARAREAGLRR